MSSQAQPAPALADSTGYPLPSYASSIWIAGDFLCLALASGPEGRPHTIRIPLAKCSVEKSAGGGTLGRQMGWQALLEVLKQRQATQRSAVRLGDRASPVQYDIEAMLGAMHTGSTTVKKFDAGGSRLLDYDDLFSGNEEPSNGN